MWHIYSVILVPRYDFKILLKSLKLSTSFFEKATAHPSTTSLRKIEKRNVQNTLDHFYSATI